MPRTTEEVLEDIKKCPEKHRHDANGLVECCMINGVVALSLIEAHGKFVSLGKNGGVNCDITSGPCACGGWH